MKKPLYLFVACLIALVCSDPLSADTFGPFTYTELENSITIDRFQLEFAAVAEVPEKIAGKPVTVIGTYAFAGYWELKHVILPQGITRIEDGAFQNCWHVFDINIPEGVTFIGDRAFYQVLSLESLDLPSSLNHIGESAFSGCDKIRTVKIPSGITSIGQYTFASCTSLSRISIPATVSHIGDYAFESCDYLKQVRFFGNAPTMGEGVFDYVSDSLVVQSAYGSKGFTYPTWLGFDSEIMPSAIIDILNPKRYPMQNGISVQSFGKAKIGKRGKSKIYTIDNSGELKLTDIAIIKSGANKSDFKVSVLPRTSVKGYGSMQFTVTFNPKGKGTREASLSIQSSDAVNPSFVVNLTGTATAR